MVLAVSAIISPAALMHFLIAWIWHLWPEHFQIQCRVYGCKVKVGQANQLSEDQPKWAQAVLTLLLWFYHSVCDPNIKHEIFLSSSWGETTLLNTRNCALYRVIISRGWKCDNQVFYFLHVYLSLKYMD